jgi:hypothetical protein
MCLVKHRQSMEILNYIKEISDDKNKKESEPANNQKSDPKSTKTISLQEEKAPIMIGPDGKPMDNGDAREKDLKDEFSLEQYCQIMGNMALSPDLIIQYVIGRIII